MFRILTALLLLPLCAQAKSVAYIHGDVAEDGTTPSGGINTYDQMLLTDTGSTGMSEFKALVESQPGYSISQHYDAVTVLDAAFLAPFDVIVFGLHQKIWSPAEKSALDNWIRAGGGILMYSDSAAGGFFREVGIDNSTGQNAVNSILSAYGMQVTVDQGQGTRSYFADSGSPNPIVWDQAIFEGEGVSPVAVDPTGIARVLIPLDPDNRFFPANDNDLNIDPVGVTIANPVWAAMAHAQVDKGNVIAVFDRQPFWNNGPGSDIDEEDNREILRRVVRFLARDYGNSEEWLDFQIEGGSPPALELSWTQWTGGTGTPGIDYIARNNRFSLEQRDGLQSGDWRSEPSLFTAVSVSPFPDGEREEVTVQIAPDGSSGSWFARISQVPDIPPPPPVIPTVDAGEDSVISESGRAWLEAAVTNAASQTWSKTSGPGTVIFADENATTTTATFTSPGIYVLELEAASATDTAADSVTVTVVEDADVLIAINCGGSAYNGANGFNYVADIYFDGDLGDIDDFGPASVANTEEDDLYNTARSKPSFAGYSIPAPNGDYLVYLQFAETYFTKNNKRVFDLSIEGNLVIDDIDLHADAPGKWVAIRRQFTTTVSGGVLDIDVTASNNNPLINAIVVVALP